MNKSLIVEVKTNNQKLKEITEEKKSDETKDKNEKYKEKYCAETKDKKKNWKIEKTSNNTVKNVELTKISELKENMKE